MFKFETHMVKTNITKNIKEMLLFENYLNFLVGLCWSISCREVFKTYSDNIRDCWTYLGSCRSAILLYSLYVRSWISIGFNCKLKMQLPQNIQF